MSTPQQQHNHHSGAPNLPAPPRRMPRSPSRSSILAPGPEARSLTRDLHRGQHRQRGPPHHPDPPHIRCVIFTTRSLIFSSWDSLSLKERCTWAANSAVPKSSGRSNVGKRPDTTSRTMASVNSASCSLRIVSTVERTLSFLGPASQRSESGKRRACVQCAAGSTHRTPACVRPPRCRLGARIRPNRHAWRVVAACAGRDPFDV